MKMIETEITILVPEELVEFFKTIGVEKLKLCSGHEQLAEYITAEAVQCTLGKLPISDEEYRDRMDKLIGFAEKMKAKQQAKHNLN